MGVQLKRAYEQPSKTDGQRILVDRLWPRGLSKDSAQIDLWLKSIAPSTELRKWFNHDPDRWDVFKTRYLEELQKNRADTDRLVDFIGAQPATLVYGAKNERMNNAMVLKEFLDSLYQGTSDS